MQDPVAGPLLGGGEDAKWTPITMLARDSPSDCSARKALGDREAPQRFIRGFSKSSLRTPADSATDGASRRIARFSGTVNKRRTLRRTPRRPGLMSFSETARFNRGLASSGQFPALDDEQPCPAAFFSNFLSGGANVSQSATSDLIRSMSLRL